ncbi:TPA: hypothetical protein NH706_006256 [Pseudomonas aeruginosa]|nr:hypothetical protein [Pseudomonas aeruginosa]HCF0722839.1 hypothetical protein [Pseudomonas aeruginosa]
MIYNRWKFKKSPFQTTSLPATELGDKLLVGRETEVDSLIRKIASPPKLATLEGLNGVGKTSIVNIASYRLFRDYIESGKGTLYIPCRKIFQLSAEQDSESFIDQVLMEVAQTLIEKAQELKEKGVTIQTKALDKWLNSPQINTYQGGVWLVQGGMQSETNTSTGFERSGFRKIVLSWLEQIFENEGGVVCTIDNMELLQSSDAARDILEKLRDELLNVNGLRWVLCGALGIVYGVVASPRLEGYLHKPIEIKSINDQHAGDILTSRIQAYSNDPKYYLPLQAEEFTSLYETLQGNLRSVLSYSDDFCQWVADRHIPITNEEKTSCFNEWIMEQAKSAHDAVLQELRPKAVEVFKNAIALGGIFSPSDFDRFGFNSIPAFRPHIRDLEAVGVLVSTQDDGDKRRKTIQVTPKGWMVDYYIKKTKA